MKIILLATGALFALLVSVPSIANCTNGVVWDTCSFGTVIKPMAKRLAPGFCEYANPKPSMLLCAHQGFYSCQENNKTGAWHPHGGGSFICQAR